MSGESNVVVTPVKRAARAIYDSLTYGAKDGIDLEPEGWRDSGIWWFAARAVDDAGLLAEAPGHNEKGT